MDSNGCNNLPTTLSLKVRLKFLLRDSALYGGAAAVSKLFALFTFPVLARVYSVADFGIIDAFTVLANLLVILIVFGQDSAIARYFYEYDDVATRRQLVSEGLALQFALMAVAVPVFWMYADRIAILYTKRENLANLCQLVIAQVPFALLINFSMNMLKWTFSRVRYLIVSVGSALFSVVAILIGVLAFGIDITGLFWIYLVTKGIFAIIGLFFCKEWLVVPRSFSHLKELLYFGMPYGVICSISAFIPTVDRSFISNVLPAEALGLYAAGYKVAFLIYLPIQAFQTAWGPFAYAIFKQSDASQTYDRVLSYFTIFMSVCVVAIAVFAEPLLVLLASKKYITSASVVGPLALGIAIQGIGWISAIGIDLSKKAYLNIYTYITYLIVTALSIYVLIGPFGIKGVALGIFIGYAFKTVFQTVLAYKAHPYRFNLKRPFFVICATIAFVVIHTQLANLCFSQSFLISGLLTLLFLLTIWVFALKYNERSLCWRWLLARMIEIKGCI
jgi:O-antigen/teichoic acid export membrane protein